jgi:hypothetical protein
LPSEGEEWCSRTEVVGGVDHAAHTGEITLVQPAAGGTGADEDFLRPLTRFRGLLLALGHSPRRTADEDGGLRDKREQACGQNDLAEVAAQHYYTDYRAEAIVYQNTQPGAALFALGNSFAV